MANLDGLKVAILVTDGFEQVELVEPRKALDQAGAETKIVSPKNDRVRGWQFAEWGDELPVDVPLDKTRPENFDALLLPGGVVNPDKLRMDPKAVSFVKSFFTANKPVAAICHGPWTIIEADQARGRRIASWPSLKTDLRNAGAEWMDRESVVDGNLVSSRKPDDIPAFNRAMIDLFSGGSRAKASTYKPLSVRVSPEMATHSSAGGARRGHAKSSPVRTITLPSGAAVPVLGQGTWRMAEDPRLRAREIAALRSGLDLGLTLIDTAEMYADGAAEELVGEAIAGRRKEVFLVSKVLPNHATRSGTIAACERSLRRLATDRLDLYLLHWRETVPLEETLAGFDSLVHSGKIRYWGVSNFDLSDMEELIEVPGGEAVQTNQVLYNLTRRGIEYDLLPWCRERGSPIMAYSPIKQGRLLNHSALQLFAEQHSATPAQIAVAWVLRHQGVITIPRASKPEHVQQNRAALDIHLTENHLDLLDRAFPPPNKPVPFEML